MNMEINSKKRLWLLLDKYLLDPRYMTKRDLQFYYRYYNMTKKQKHFKKIIVAVFCICFFSYIFIDFNLKTKLIHLRDRFELIARVDADYNISQAYSIDLPGCRMPYFPVTDDNIIQFMYKPRNFSCRKALIRTSGENVLELNMHGRELYETYEIRDMDEVSCNYTEVKRINDQRNQYLDPVPFKLERNKSVTLKTNVEFLMVECWDKQLQSIYKDFHFFVLNDKKNFTNTSDRSGDLTKITMADKTTTTQYAASA